MPKDATKNVDRYKIRGGQLNEFEYAENQKALAEKKSRSDANLIPGTPPEQARDGVQAAVKTAAKKSTTKPGKATKSTKRAQAAKSATTGRAAKSTRTAKSTDKKKRSTRGASAKKLAARKAAKK
jgi:hypothetical protein